MHRRFLRTFSGFLLIAACSMGSAAEIGTPLPPWQRGFLDIHQIATGRGNAALIVCPDGTSIMIDAGAASGGPDVSCPPRPDGSRRPGEWIARYALRHLRATGKAGLDYLVVTHLHPDHLGDFTQVSPRSTRGDYSLTGVTDVAELLPIGAVMDRGFPHYTYPKPWPAGFALNYFAFIAARQKAGDRCEQVRAGAVDQIVLRHAAAEFPSFAVRNIAVNGVVWTGQSNATQTEVPPLRALELADYPDENLCSVALRLSYGKFDYFTGGDLHFDTAHGTQPWRDLETPVALATGRVEVAVANHHAYFDAAGPEAVRALQPLAWVVPAWHITHLNIASLERMLSERLYAGPRDVFVTDLMPATRLINERFMKKVASVSGHVIVRVEPGGDSFRVFITDNRDEADTVRSVSGPYRCR
jgi:hypothetical protein